MSEMIVRLNQDRVKIKGCEYVQDLIRCEDCKYYKYGFCDCWYDGTRPDAFCSFAEPNVIERNDG